VRLVFSLRLQNAVNPDPAARDCGVFERMMAAESGEEDTSSGRASSGTNTATGA